MSELISYTPSYRVGDKLFADLKSAQVAGIENILGNGQEVTAADGDYAAAAEAIVEHSDEVMAVLKQKERVRTRKPSTRKRKASCTAPSTPPTNIAAQ